jgi:hypothetical protein
MENINIALKLAGFPQPSPERGQLWLLSEEQGYIYLNNDEDIKLLKAFAMDETSYVPTVCDISNAISNLAFESPVHQTSQLDSTGECDWRLITRFNSFELIHFANTIEECFANTFIEMIKLEEYWGQTTN